MVDISVGKQAGAMEILILPPALSQVWQCAKEGTGNYTIQLSTTASRTHSKGQLLQTWPYRPDWWDTFKSNKCLLYFS